MLAAHGLEPERCCRVMIDCAGCGRDSPTAVLARLYEELAAAITPRLHLESVSHEATTYRDFERAVRKITAEGIQIIFLLDEFDTLCANPHLDADLFSGLRSLAMRYSVAYVTATAQPLLALPGAGYGALSSPFFNFFAQIRLGLFDMDEALLLLAELSMRGGAPFSSDLLATLLDLAIPTSVSAPDRWLPRL